MLGARESRNGRRPHHHQAPNHPGFRFRSSQAAGWSSRSSDGRSRRRNSCTSAVRSSPHDFAWFLVPSSGFQSSSGAAERVWPDHPRPHLHPLHASVSSFPRRRIRLLFAPACLPVATMGRAEVFRSPSTAELSARRPQIGARWCCVVVLALVSRTLRASVCGSQAADHRNA